MTALPPDPDPVNLPNVDGTGVAPGETPPDSAQTSATANPDPPVRPKYTPATIATFIAIALFLALFATTGVLLVLKLIGAIG